MMDTAKLQAAQEAASAARAALLVAMSESSAVEALHLTPLIAQAATLETEIRRLAQAIQEDTGATP
jgi:hypothetical protein